MLNTGDRVRLKRDGSSGVVVGTPIDGNVYVRLDRGSASTFPVSDVEVMEPERKTWPPEGIETK